jgi:Uma2 family endonuclease
MTVTLPERPADLDEEVPLNLVEPEPEGPDLGEMRTAIDELVDGRFKVEIIGGEIIVSPLARTLHDLIVSCMHAMFVRALDEDTHNVSQRIEFVVDEKNNPQPDLAIMDMTLRTDRLEATQYAAKDALLVVEVASPSNGDDDRKWGRKYKAYAKGLVAIYLLIDPHAEYGPSLTLFTQPDGKRYQAETTVPFGTPLQLPEPFDAVTIDSSRFPLPNG